MNLAGGCRTRHACVCVCVCVPQLLPIYCSSRFLRVHQGLHPSCICLGTRLTIVCLSTHTCTGCMQQHSSVHLHCNMRASVHHPRGCSLGLIQAAAVDLYSGYMCCCFLLWMAAKALHHWPSMLRGHVSGDSGCISLDQAMLHEPDVGPLCTLESWGVYITVVYVVTAAGCCCTQQLYTWLRKV